MANYTHPPPSLPSLSLPKLSSPPERQWGQRRLAACLLPCGPRSYTHHHYHWRRLTPIVYVVIAAAVAAAVALLRSLVLRPAAEDEIHTFMPPWTRMATASMSSLPPATAPRATPTTTTVVIQIHRSWWRATTTEPDATATPDRHFPSTPLPSPLPLR
uniref:Uncharacterized protein n=1 Tax=Oryza rufipogon TaxID=4529 RepID=A0A0E0PIF7_ORYRU